MSDREYKYKIKSDGTSQGTVVYYDGQEMSNIAKMTLEFDVDEPVAKAIITIVVPEVEVEMTKDQVKLTSDSYIRCEKCSKWLIPSIEEKEDKTVAKYSCADCQWIKEIDINFNYLEK